MHFKNYLTHNLNFLMQSLNITSNALSKNTGVRTATIYKLKEGVINNPTLETIYPIAKFFKFSLDELVGVKLYKTISESIKTSIPLISFLEANKYPNTTIIRYINTDLLDSQNKYCIQICENNCKFEKDSILIIDTIIKHESQDYVIVERKTDKHLSIKKIINDGDSFLQSITHGLESKLFEINSYKIIGTVVGYIKYLKEIIYA